MSESVRGRKMRKSGRGCSECKVWKETRERVIWVFFLFLSKGGNEQGGRREEGGGRMEGEGKAYFFRMQKLR